LTFKFKRLLAVLVFLAFCPLAKAQFPWSQKVYGANGFPPNPTGGGAPSNTYVPYCTVPASQTAQQTLLYNPGDGMLESWWPDNQSGGHEWGQSLFAYDPNNTNNTCPSPGGTSGGMFLLYDSMLHQNGGNGSVIGTAIQSISWSAGVVTVITTAAGTRSFCASVANPWPWCAGPSTISVGGGNAPQYVGPLPTNCTTVGVDNTGIMNGSSPDCAYNGQYQIASVSNCIGSPTTPTYLCQQFTYNEPNTPQIMSYTCTSPPACTTSGAQPAPTKIIGPADAPLTPVGRHSEGSAFDKNGNFWMGAGVGDSSGGATRIYTTHAGIMDLYEAVENNSTSGCTTGAKCYVFNAICGIAAGTWCATPNAQVSTPAGNGIPCTVSQACGYNFPLTGYDAKYNVLVFFGGAWSSNSQCETLLYAINTGTWTNLETAPGSGGTYPCPTTNFSGGTYPYPRWAQSQSTIPGDGNGNLIMFGFQYTNTAATTFNDTWVLNLTSATAGTWKRVQDNCYSSCPVNQPPPTMNPLMSYICSLNEVMLVDGQAPAAHTWAFRPSGGSCGSTTLAQWQAGTWTDLNISSLTSPTGPTGFKNTFCTALSNNSCQNNSPTNFNATGAFDPNVTDAFNCNQAPLHQTIAGCFVAFVKNATISGANAEQIWMLPVPITSSGALAPLTVQNKCWPGSTCPSGTDTNLPVTVGVPVAESVGANGCQDFQLQVNSVAQNWSCQILANWPSGKTKVLLADFQESTFTSGPTGVDSSHVLTYTPATGGNQPSANLAINCTAPNTPDLYCPDSNHIIVRTIGAAATSNGVCSPSAISACFSIKKNNFNLFDAVDINCGNLACTTAGTGIYHFVATGSHGANDGIRILGPTPGQSGVTNQVSCAAGCNTAYLSNQDSTSTATIEEAGSMRTAILVNTLPNDGSGDTYVACHVRMHFYAGRSDVKIVSVCPQNAQQPGSLTAPGNDLQTAYKQYKSAELIVTWAGLSVNANWGIGNHTTVPTTGTTLSGTQVADLTTGFQNKHLASDIATASNGLPQCNATGTTTAANNWDCFTSPIARSTGTPCPGLTTGWFYTQCGYQINLGTIGTQTTQFSGQASQYPAGWADVDNGVQGVEIGIDDLAAHWPKALELASGGAELHVAIAPDQSLFLGGGGQDYVCSYTYYCNDTNTLWFFHPAVVSGSNYAAANEEFLDFQHPLIARAPVAYYNQACSASTPVCFFPNQIPDPSQEDAYHLSIGLACSQTVANSPGQCLDDVQDQQNVVAITSGAGTPTITVPNTTDAYSSSPATVVSFYGCTGGCSPATLTVTAVTSTTLKFGSNNTPSTATSIAYPITAKGTQPVDMAVYPAYLWGEAGAGNQHDVMESFIQNWIQRGYNTTSGSVPGRYAYGLNFITNVADTALPHSDWTGHWRSLCTGTPAAPSCPANTFDQWGWPQKIQMILPAGTNTANMGIENWCDELTSLDHCWPAGIVEWYYLTGDRNLLDSIHQGGYDRFNLQLGYSNGLTGPNPGHGNMGVTRATGHALHWISELCRFSYDTGNANYPTTGDTNSPCPGGFGTGVARTAASCSVSDITTQINLSTAGDTVYVPGGNCTWTLTSPLTLTASNLITIDGGGANINMGTTNNGNLSAVVVTTPATGLQRITNFNFTGSLNNGQSAIHVNTGNSTTGATFRLDHNTFDDGSPAAQGTIVAFSGGGAWLMDHNTLTAHHGSDELVHNSWFGTFPTGWTNDYVPGGPVSGFFEDNTCTYLSTSGFFDASSCIENFSAARITARHNTLNNMQFDAHGSGGSVSCTPTDSENSTRFWELYNNTYNTFAGINQSNYTSLRGGSGIEFNETVTGGNTIQGAFEYTEDCQPGATYPLQTQIGRGINQTSSPAYIWGISGNTALWKLFNGNTTYIQSGASVGACASVSPNHNPCDLVLPASAPATLNRCESAADQSAGCPVVYTYTPYTYPHPLITPVGKATGISLAGENIIAYVVQNPQIDAGFPLGLTDSTNCPDGFITGGQGAGPCSSGISPVRGFQYNGVSDSFIATIPISSISVTSAGPPTVVTAACTNVYPTDSTGANCDGISTSSGSPTPVYVSGVTPVAFDCHPVGCASAYVTGTNVTITYSSNTPTGTGSPSGCTGLSSGATCGVSPGPSSAATMQINAAIPPGDDPTNHATTKAFMTSQLEEGIFEFAQTEEYIRGYDWSGVTFTGVLNGTSSNTQILSDRSLLQSAYAIGNYIDQEHFQPKTLWNPGGLGYDNFHHFLNTTPPAFTGGPAKLSLPNGVANGTSYGDWGYGLCGVVGPKIGIPSNSTTAANEWQPDYELYLQLVQSIGGSYPQERYSHQYYVTDNCILKGSALTSQYTPDTNVATLQPMQGFTVNGLAGGHCNGPSTCNTNWASSTSIPFLLPAPNGNPTPYWFLTYSCVANSNAAGGCGNSTPNGLQIVNWQKFHNNCQTSSLTIECTNGTGLIANNPCNGGLNAALDPVTGQSPGCWEPGVTPDKTVNFFASTPVYPQPLSTATSQSFSCASGLVCTAALFAYQQQQSTTPTVSQVTFAPAGGTYTGSQNVTLSVTTPGSVTICYTTDGSTPTEVSHVCSGGTTQTYIGTAIPVATGTTVLTAIGTLTGFNDTTPPSQATYIINSGTIPPPPTGLTGVVN
jgi:hypothetical protein